MTKSTKYPDILTTEQRETLKALVFEKLGEGWYTKAPLLDLASPDSPFTLSHVAGTLISLIDSSEIITAADYPKGRKIVYLAKAGTARFTGSFSGSLAIYEALYNRNIMAEAIYDAHLVEFHNGNLPHDATARKFPSREAVAEALEAGELFPAIWRQVANHVLTPYQAIGLYSLLDFSSYAVERKFKASFIACVENLLNV